MASKLNWIRAAITVTVKVFGLLQPFLSVDGVGEGVGVVVSDLLTFPDVSCCHQKHFFPLIDSDCVWVASTVKIACNGCV